MSELVTGLTARRMLGMGGGQFEMALAPGGLQPATVVAGQGKRAAAVRLFTVAEVERYRKDMALEASVRAYEAVMNRGYHKARATA